MSVQWGSCFGHECFEQMVIDKTYSSAEIKISAWLYEMLREFNKMKTYSYTQNSQSKAYKCQALDPLKYEFNIFSYCNGLRPAFLTTIWSR